MLMVTISHQMWIGAHPLLVILSCSAAPAADVEDAEPAEEEHDPENPDEAKEKEPPKRKLQEVVSACWLHACSFRS